MMTLCATITLQNCHDNMYIRFPMSCTSQSKPSCTPVPCTGLHPCTLQCRLPKCLNSSDCVRYTVPMHQSD